MKRLLAFFRRQEDGQSLAEAALILPVLIILIAGVVEVSHMAVTQSRITSAARSGARFGANGGEDTGMVETTLRTAIETIGDDESVWDIWIIRAQVDDMGDIPIDDFSFDHVYGLGQTSRFTDTSTITFTNDLRLKIEAQLQLDESATPGGADSSGLRVVGVYALYDIDSIIGLNILPNLAGLRSMKGYSIMRQASLAASVNLTSGCNGVFPLILHEQTRNMNELEFGVLVEGNFTYPTGSNEPRWEDFVVPPDLNGDGFPDSLDISEGIEGVAYYFPYAPFAAQSMGWLRWNDSITGVGGGSSILNESLLWPGNNTLYAGQPGDTPAGALRGYAEPGDPTDTTMHLNDWVVGEPSDFTASGVLGTLNNHIDSERALRVVLWEPAPSGGNYVISGFAIFRIAGYQTNNWILLEFVRMDRSCGQTVN